jgi:DNA-binding NarL/FixJ family response regulator
VPLRLLLADDDERFLEGLLLLLADDPRITVVGCARSGGEAVVLASALAPDLVLIDIEMPLGDGIEATERIRATDPSACVVVLTGADRELDRLRAMRAGASACLQKQEALHDLAETLLRRAAEARSGHD